MEEEPVVDQTATSNLREVSVYYKYRLCLFYESTVELTNFDYTKH